MIPFPDKKYKVIYADPPWHFNDRADKRGVEYHYQTMLTEDIKTLPVSDIAEKDSVLFLWAVFPMLQEGLDVIRAWGFEYKTIGFVWVKTWKNGSIFMGMGNWTRSNPEACLIGVKGKPKRVDAGVPSVVISEIAEHSKKPDRVRRDIVKLCGDVPRIELFARQKAYGWDAWGNQVPDDVQPLPFTL